MKKRTDREILNAAVQQVEAMLLFAWAECGAGKPRRSKRPDYRTKGKLKALVELADLLNGKFEEYPYCAACDKPVRAHQAYVHDSEDGLTFHATCMNIPAKTCLREPGPAYYRRSMTKRANEAREWLVKQGMMA